MRRALANLSHESAPSTHEPNAQAPPCAGIAEWPIVAGSKQLFHYFNYTGNNTWLGLWDDGYGVIVTVNRILENIDQLPEASDEEVGFKNNVRGEALALCALAHFDMARVFSTMPSRAEEGDLGIPYMLFSDPTQLPGCPPRWPRRIV